MPPASMRANARIPRKCATSLESFCPRLYQRKGVPLYAISEESDEGPISGTEGQKSPFFREGARAAPFFSSDLLASSGCASERGGREQGPLECGEPRADFDRESGANATPLDGGYERDENVVISHMTHSSLTLKASKTTKSGLNLFEKL